MYKYIIHTYKRKRTFTDVFTEKNEFYNLRFICYLYS